LKGFLSLADFTPEGVEDLLGLAARLERRPEPEALKGKVLALLFFNPSLRTLASFQAGMARLGGSSFVISPGQGTWTAYSRKSGSFNSRFSRPPLACGLAPMRRCPDGASSWSSAIRRPEASNSFSGS